MNIRSVHYVGMHMQHHASLSGYDQLAHVRPGELLDDCTGAEVGLEVKLLKYWVQRAGNYWYNRQSMRAELTIFKRLMTQQSEVIHLLYGENTYRYSGALSRRRKNRNNRLIATYHTPEARLQELIGNKQHLRSLDAVILMSENQRNYFADVIAPERVHFVPHGINTDYFRPCPLSIERISRDQARPFRCITVGHHLRDYNLLAKVALRALQEQLDIEFVVVARPDRTAAIAGLPNVTQKSGISNEELLQLYQTSDVLFLPLLEATANNSLLEGMACGLPIISSDLEGVRDYAPKSALLAPKGDHGLSFELLRTMVQDQTNSGDQRASSRARALELDWKNIRTRLDNIYQRC